MKKPVYIRCPRCELNYIQKKDKYCSVCKAELEAKSDYIDDIDLELCPICKTNYIQPDEIMCANCLKEHQNEDGELSGDWEDYLSREDDEDIVTMDDETGEMASVTDITKASLLDDDGDIGGDLDFDDEVDGVDFDDEEFEEEDEILDEDDLDIDLDDDEDFDDEDEDFGDDDDE